MEPISREPLRSAVRRVLLDRVLAGHLRSNEPLIEAEVAEALGVSRTPLREALVGLEAEGIIQSRPGRGFSVAPLSAAEGRDLYALMALLEGQALRESGAPGVEALAALRELDRARVAFTGDPRARVDLDTRWHTELLSSCPNRKLLWILSLLRGQLYRYEYAFHKDRSRVIAAVDQHEAILTALEAGDAPGAAEMLEAHWRGGVERVTRDFEA